MLPLEIEPPIVQGLRDREVVNGEEQRPEEVRRWTAKRRAALVISLLKGETSVAEAARRHGLKIAEVEEWRDRFLLGAENALRARPKEVEALREEELNRFKRKVGELTMDLEILLTAPGCLSPAKIICLAWNALNCDQFEGRRSEPRGIGP